MRLRAVRKDGVCRRTTVPKSQQLSPTEVTSHWCPVSGVDVGGRPLRSHRGAGWQGAIPARPPSP